jgi:hypothetical protein
MTGSQSVTATSHVICHTLEAGDRGAVARVFGVKHMGLITVKPCLEWVSKGCW